MSSEKLAWDPVLDWKASKGYCTVTLVGLFRRWFVRSSRQYKSCTYLNVHNFFRVTSTSLSGVGKSSSTHSVVYIIGDNSGVIEEEDLLELVSKYRVHKPKRKNVLVGQPDADFISLVPWYGHIMISVIGLLRRIRWGIKYGIRKIKKLFQRRWKDEKRHGKV